jgi:hypothetical protein
MDDWAVLVDLSVVGNPNWSGKSEFGIVRRGEVPLRFSRMVSRVALWRVEVGIDHWHEDEFPDVAFFADNTWQRETDASEGDLLSQAWLYWNEARPRTARFVSELHAKIVGSQRTQGGNA